MIDFHTHILPHLDDGAKDSEMAIAMLQSELSQGVTDVVLTSHYYGRKHSPERFIEKRNAAWARLKPLVPQGINAHLAAEVHFTGVNVPNFDELCKLAIAGTEYILIEFPFTQKWASGILSALASFVYETSYTPIIAHVERYQEVQKKPSIIQELLEMGCLLQVNASAFVTKKEKDLAFALLKKGLLHCIGTDTHDMGIRKPNMKEIKAVLEEAGYGEEWTNIQERMRMVLQGKRIERPEIKPIKRFFGKYI